MSTSRCNRLRTLGLVLLLAAPVGCSDTIDPTKFNQHMYESNRQLAQAAWEFRESVLPLQQNQLADLNRVMAAHENLRRVLSKIKEERREMKLPDTPAVQDMNRAYDEFLQGEEQRIEQGFATLVVIAGIPTLSPHDRWGRMQGEMGKIQEQGRSDWQKVMAAQQKFANDVGMRVIYAQ